MSMPPRFQDLPERVCATVANCLAFNTASPPIRARATSSGDGRALLPLLAVSTHWRTAALSCIGSWSTATSSADGRCTISFPLNPCPSVLDIPLPRVLQQTRLTVDCALLTSELGRESLAAHADSYRPVANSEYLRLAFVADLDTLSDCELDSSAVEAAAGIVKQLGQCARSMDVLFGDAGHPMNWDMMCRFNEALAPHANTVGARRLCTLPALSKGFTVPDSLPTGLAGISLTLTDGCPRILELVHANAATLERLEISVADAMRLHEVFRTACHEPILYPELRTLILTPVGDPLAPSMMTLKAANYCPKLRYLNIGLVCSFDIFLLLQSCYESVRHIDIVVGESTLTCMRSYLESTGGRSSQAKDVIARCDATRGDNTLWMDGKLDCYDYALASRAALAIMPSVERVEIVNSNPKHRLPIDFSYPEATLRNLVAVVARDVTLDSKQLVWLLREAPRLERIMCHSVTLSSDLEGVDSAKRPRFLRREYFPHIGSLLELDMSAADMDAGKTALLILLVKMMCPGFTYASVADSLLSPCREQFKEEKKRPQYKVYHSQLANVHFRTTR